MERSRSISISLILLTLALGYNARNIVELETKNFVLLTCILVMPHVIGYTFSKSKFLQNFSPIISAVVGLELTLFQANLGLFPSAVNLSALSRLGQEGIKQFREQSVPIKNTIGAIVVLAFVFWAVSELLETMSRRLRLFGTTFGLYILAFAISTFISKDDFDIVAISAFCFASWFYLRTTYKSRISSSANEIHIDAKIKIQSLIKNIVLIVAVITICILVAIPIDPPSLAPDNLLDRIVNKSATTELSPLVSMRAQLKGNNNDLMFVAKTNSAQYFRVGVLNKFDGDTWSYDSNYGKNTETPVAGRESSVASAQFELKGLEPKFLPTIYNTTDTSSRELKILENSTVFSKDGKVTSYSIDARVPSNTLSESQIQMTSQQTPPELDDYLLIPKDFDPRIEELTRTIARNKSSVYEQVLSLKDYFTNGQFTYSTDVKYTSSQKSMSEFLDKKIGFCEQFAATYAAMARSIRIPSRVIIGFSPGAPDANGEFNVRAKQAHSWVEVYLTGVGWITIDPTPSGNLPGQAPSNIGESVVTTTTTTTTTVTTPQDTSVSSVPITKSTVVPVNNNESSSSIFTMANIIIFLLFLLVTAGIFAYVIYLRKKKATITKISLVHDAYQKVLKRFIDKTISIDVTMAEAKMHIPNEFADTQKFIDKYSDFSYSHDSDIDIDELSESAESALNEISAAKKEKTSV